MARRYQPTVVTGVSYKPKDRNHARFTHEGAVEKERREIAVKLWCAELGCGVEVTFRVNYRYDPRENLRAYVPGGQCRRLPDYLTRQMRAAGFNFDKTAVPFTRILVALWGLGSLTGRTDVHHRNHTPLDDRAVNLEVMDKKDHARYHITQRWEIAKGVNPEGGFKGFFDYRKLGEAQRKLSREIAIENARRKKLGLPPTNRQQFKADRVAEQQKYMYFHRQLLSELGISVT